MNLRKKLGLDLGKTKKQPPPAKPKTAKQPETRSQDAQPKPQALQPKTETPQPKVENQPKKKHKVQMKPRLPDNSSFVMVYNATTVRWTGTLTIPGSEQTYQEDARSVFALCCKLDNLYRKYLKAQQPPQEEKLCPSK